MRNLGKTQIGKRKLSLIACGLIMLAITTLMQANLVYGADIARLYRIAVTLFNESEYEAAENRFSTVIQDGKIDDPADAALVINSYYGRGSCRIERGKKLKEERKFEEALDIYNQAYQDFSVFKSKFEELQETLRSDPLYDEMEKHFVTISDQMVQLAGEAGDICTKQGNYDKAIEWYDKSLLYISTRNPVYGDILYAKADAVFQLGRYEDALDLLSRFGDELSDHSKVSNAMLFAGDIHRILGERKDDKSHIADALDAYSRVVSEYMEGADVELVKTALLAKARSEKELGRMEEAMVDFRRLQEYYPDTTFEVEAALEIGDYLFLAKRYDEAIASFDRAIDVAKSLDLPYFVAISYYWMGWSYYRDAARLEVEAPPEMERRIEKLYKESIDAFKDSIDYSEKFWKEEGREVQKARELESYYGESLFRIGRGYQALEKWNDAIEAFEKIPSKYKEWWLEGIAEIAVSRERKGDVEGSLAMWDELKTQIRLANVPNVELKLLMARADSLYDLQRYSQAEKAYREITVKYPTSPDDAGARVHLGLCLFKQERDKEAIQEFTAMLSKHRGNEELGSWIGEALFWRGYLTARVENGENLQSNLKRAIDDYRQLISMYPNHIRADDAQSEIGFCTYSLGAFDEQKYSEAVLEYLKVLDNYPGSEYADDALFEIGRCYRLLGNEANEEDSLRKLVRDYPTSEWADDALLRVAEIHFDRAQTQDSASERQIAQSIYSEVVAKYPDTGPEVIAHFQMGSMSYKFDDDLRIAAAEFEKCAQVAERLLNKIIAGEYVPTDLDITTTADLLLKATFWQAESLFALAAEAEDAAQPLDVVKEAYGQARVVYQKLLNRGTALRNNFPGATENLYNIMAGADLDIPIISESQYMIGRCLFKERDFSGARTALLLVKSPEKQKLKAELLLAYIAFELGEISSAKNMVERWTSAAAAQDMADEYAVEAQLLQAKIDLASGDVAGAKAQALDTWALHNAVDGLWEEAAYIVAKCYQQQNDMEKAITWFEKLQESSIERWRVMANEGLTQLGIEEQ